jgi:hypothetical protein
MVQQVLGKRDIGGNLGRAIGGAFVEGSKEANQYALNRSRLDEALTNLESIKDLDKLPFSQQVTAAARALLPAPGGSQVLSELLPFLQKNSKAAAQNKAFGGTEEGGGQAQPGLQGQPGQRLPNFMNQPGGQGQGQGQQQNPNYPNVEVPPTDYNTLPGKSTGPNTVPLKSGEELSRAALETQQRSLGTANPMSYDEAFKFEVDKNAANQAYNQQLEGEKNANKLRQQEIIQQVDSLTNQIYPDASPEERALFSTWGTEAAEHSEKESEQRNYVSRKLKDYKTNVANIESQINRPNWINSQYHKLRGNAKSVDEAKANLKSLVKPLLDAGMVDKARSLLSQMNWMPVEIEEIVSTPLTPEINNMVNSQPRSVPAEQSTFQKGLKNFGGVIGNVLGDTVFKTDERRQEAIDNTFDTLQNVFKTNRDVNLVLLREAFEKRGVNWNEFGQAFNKLVESGEIKLNPDQQKQLKNLTEPPLSYLDNFFHNINLKGK